MTFDQVKSFLREGCVYHLDPQLFNDERKEGESLRNYIFRMKHLNSLCKLEERLWDFYMKDIFLKGLNHPMIYKGLAYSQLTRLNASWHECAHRSIRIEDHIPSIVAEKLKEPKRTLPQQLLNTLTVSN